ncbi:MAG: pantoate--beta-alanine ligase [Pseudomonadota bacterium]
MEIVRTVAALRARVRAWQAEGLNVALVPTMGALHHGHLSLVRLGLTCADRAVATIFVNPTQFGAGEDLSAYPRDEASDAQMLRDAGCHLLFAPPLAEVYPPGFATRVIVDGLTDCLCGAARPGHFDGVAQVVTKLLNQAGADFAVFGEKDWQQLAIIRRLTRDLDIATRILGAPILREADGLAMSSRNRYLSDAERAVAGHLSRVLREVAAQLSADAPIAESVTAAERTLLDLGFQTVDYVEARAAETLAPWKGSGAPAGRVFAAAWLGRARLIDNFPIPQTPGSG